MTWVLLAVAAVVVAAIVVALIKRSRDADGVDSFRRQIDALSPAARRPVVERVRHARHDHDDDHRDEDDEQSDDDVDEQADRDDA